MHRDASHVVLTAQRRERILATQIECTFCRTNRDGHLIAVTQALAQAEGIFWTASETTRARVRAVRRHPRTSCVITAVRERMGVSHAATGARTASMCRARTRAGRPSHPAELSRRALRWAVTGLVCQHLSVARVAEGLAVSWDTANGAVLAEGRRVLINDPSRFDGVTVVGGAYDVVLPTCSDNHDRELELAAVIGVTGFQVNGSNVHRV